MNRRALCHALAIEGVKLLIANAPIAVVYALIKWRFG